MGVFRFLPFGALVAVDESQYRRALPTPLWCDQQQRERRLQQIRMDTTRRFELVVECLDLEHGILFFFDFHVSLPLHSIQKNVTRYQTTSPFALRS